MFHWRAFFPCVIDEMFMEVPLVPRNLPCPENFLAVCLHLDILFAKRSILMFDGVLNTSVSITAQ